MKPLCATCEARPVYVVAARHYGSNRNVDTHDLCDRCYRSLRDRVVASRKGSKPHWATRSTLKVMAEQQLPYKPRMG